MIVGSMVVINPLPDNKFDYSNLKEIVNDNSNLTKMEENYPNRRKTLWEKEKLLVKSNFSFSQCFQKACFPGASEGVIVWEWVNLSRQQQE